MINRGTFDRLEDAIDHFEETWSLQSQSKIEELLADHGLSDDEEAIVELIRIDIELRYERGLSIELGDYLDRFTILQERPQRVAEIAFEDYRSRAAKGHPVSVMRWRGLPGVNRESWFQELMREASVHQTRARTARLKDDPTPDAAFEFALAEAGFQLVQKIGEGAFSCVYLATQVELADRFVVLKIVTETLAEPEYMALLQHTNIVPIYSFHQILSRSVICMPYAGRVTLHEFLKDKTVVSERGGQSLIRTVRERIGKTTIKSEDGTGGGSDVQPAPLVPAAEDKAGIRPLEAFRSLDCEALAICLFQRLAGALAHAHARGVLHNDLKPSNVLIRNDGEPALLDFNLSQTLGQKNLRHAGGTLPYMSPETYRAMMGHQTQPGAASDVYGLGVMLFEFVTGRLPYPTPASIASIDLDTAIEARRSRPNWQATDGVHPGMRAIVDRCLQFEPQQRYASADDLQADLQREQENMGLLHAAEPQSWKVKKWTRRHPRAIASGLVATVLIAILVPLSYLTVASLEDNRSLRSQVAFEAFSEESAEFLSSVMADPNRQKASNVHRGVALLEEYDALDPEVMERWVSQLGHDQQQLARETFFRHIAHVAILETQRLAQLRRSDPEASQDLTRLDRLIEAAKAVEHDRPTRARLFLEAERARLAGNDERYQVLDQIAADTPAQTDSQLYLEAVRRLADHDHHAASDLLAALADRNSVPPALRWTMLGRAQFAAGRVEDAKLSFTQSIERAPESAKLRELRGRCHFDLREDASAERDYRKAIELDPESVGGWSQLGLLHYANQRYEQALDCFNRSLELAPGRIWTLLKRSKTYRALGEHDSADADYLAAMSVPCDDPNELSYRAGARFKTEPDAALADLRAACELDPDRPALQRELAQVLAVGLGRHEEAIEAYGKVLQMQPNNEVARIDRALSLIRLGRTQEALADTKVAMEEPNSGRTLYQAACVHALIGKDVNKRRAVTLLAKAIAQGYQPASVGRDQDLASIRDREEFRVIERFLETSRRERRGQPLARQDTHEPSELETY
ncbi:Serine/threonine-protein kinase PrkC [Stieleria neptunia]|uniref:Serine/threonine-protein kinase PrkC n=1 Tax=Stieleria neptunia TaxID=2527979 RepID=A0A518I3I9_9BACT|nr:tetratricopeptide repeat protein [Stieleria neptunia]QDV47670.1 Serine/threonine-protein kinase PrkC [Stieleria neptunia]